MFRRQDALLADIVQYNLLFTRGSELRDGVRHFVWAGQFDPRYPEASRLAKHLHQQSTSPVIAALCLGHLLVEGPKFFEFGARDCEALENFSLDLPAEEYGQPFPTLMIKLPGDYIDARVQSIQSYGHIPQSIIIHHDKTLAVVLVSIRFRDGMDVAYHLALDRPGCTVEQSWEELRDYVRGRVAESLRELAELAQALTRLSLSACLMTMVYGATRLGPDNPGHHQRLKRHVISARKSGDGERLRNAEFDLQALPIRYRFAQDVHLYRVETAPERAADGAPTGRVVAPHWRRGHYRMQAFGPGLSLRRRIAVPAVLVNGHFFLGERADAAATYRA